MSQIDCHCHTKYSKCSNLEPKDILKICRKKQLDGIVICDHGTTRGYQTLKSLLNHKDDFILIPGIEILTERGELLALWTENLPHSNSFPEIANEIHSVLFRDNGFCQTNKSGLLYTEFCSGYGTNCGIFVVFCVINVFHKWT